MPDKHGCDGLSDSYKVREVGWCQNIDFSDHCATNYFKHSVDWPPPPPTPPALWILDPEC